MNTSENMMQSKTQRFNEYLMNMDRKDMPIGLYYGKMGLCIYFFETGKLLDKPQYTDFAEKLLDEVIAESADFTAIDHETGLTGICIAINYLLKNDFVKGNPNIVLEDFDTKIIQSLLFNRVYEDNSKINTGLLKLTLGSLDYLATRLENNELQPDKRFIIENTIIEYINKIESYTLDKYADQLAFTISGYFVSTYLRYLYKLYNINFYNYKIDKVLDELSERVSYLFPSLECNRLLLWSSISRINKIKNYNTLKTYAKVLISNTTIDNAINEFRNKDIMLNNGLCGFYYLLKSENIHIQYKSVFEKKIENSDMWKTKFEEEEKLKHNLGLFNGFAGVILTYLDVKENVKNTFFDIIFN